MEDTCNDSSGSDEVTASCKKQLKKADLSLRDYRKTIHRLEEALACKDRALKELKEDGEIKNAELKRLVRVNHKLEQMLTEERSHYSKEKEQFCHEMLEKKRMVAELQTAAAPYQIKNSYLNPGSTASKTHFNNNLFSEIAALRTENEKLRVLVEKSDERNYEVCVKFLRMQRSKELTWEKLKEVDEDFLKSLNNLMEKFNDLREEFNFLLGDRSAGIPQDKFSELTKRNCNLSYENNCLKLELQCLRKDIHRGIYGLSAKIGSEEGNTSGSGYVCQELKSAYPRWANLSLKTTSSEETTQDINLLKSDKNDQSSEEELSITSISEANTIIFRSDSELF